MLSIKFKYLMKKHDLTSILNQLMTTSIYGIIITDDKGNIEYFSQQGSNIFKTMVAETIGKNIQWLIPLLTFKEGNLVFDQSKGSLIEQKNQGYEISIKNKEGEDFILFLTYSQATLEDVAVWTFICRDLTNINAENKRITEDKIRLDAVINTAVDGIITIDEKGTIETVNPAAAHLFGYEPKEMIHQNINMLMATPHHEQHNQYLKNYLSTGIKKIIGIGRQVEGLRKDGTLFPFKLSISEINFDKKRIFTGIVHDLSDKFRVKEIERALQQEKDLNKLKSHFITIASHEFRTPLSSILSSTALIEKYETKEQQDKRTKHTQRIKQSVNHLTTILNDFLLLSKLDEGLVKYEPIHFDLKAFCEEIMQEMQYTIKSEIKIHLSYEGAQKVYLDKKLLTNIMQNLLSNAIKYSTSNKDIYFKAIITPENIKLSVKDEGIGIPLEEQKQLFQRFFRAKNAKNLQGTGIGLNIVRKYVRLMHGDITVHSIPDEGSTFTISFPNQKQLL